MRLLLVEDEKSLRDIIKLNLELENWEVVVAVNGEEALNKIDSEYYDIIVLDLMIPKINGIDVLKSFRIKKPDVPVIIISAKSTSSDRIKGLKVGADDYLAKPFDIEELLIRINKLVNRNASSADSKPLHTFTFGNNTVDFKSFSANKNGEIIELKPKEMQILQLLILNKNDVVSRKDILKSVWGYDVFPSTRTIDNFIASLRKHFEADPKNPVYIKSIRGIGYKFSLND